jgi:hypothetical protein
MKTNEHDLHHDGDFDESRVHDDRVGARLGMAQHGIVSAIFRDSDDAESAYRELRDHGYSQDEVTVLMSEQARDEFFPTEDVVVEKERKTLEGTGAGGAIGAAVGALAGAIAAIGTTILVPGLGLVVAGPLAAAIAGAGAGGMAGGLIGAMIGTGMSEEKATVYRTAIEEGGIVMTVTPHSPEDAEWIAHAWEDSGAEEIYRSA